MHKCTDECAQVRRPCRFHWLRTPLLFQQLLSGGDMQEYRLYVFEAGRVLPPREFYAADDQGAIDIAEQSWTKDLQMELWAHGRKVRGWGFPNSHHQQDR